MRSWQGFPPVCRGAVAVPALLQQCASHFPAGGETPPLRTPGAMNGVPTRKQRQQLSLFPVPYGPAGPISLKTVRRTVFRALDIPIAYCLFPIAYSLLPIA